MDSEQYEELCRLFIAAKEGLSLDEVQSVRIPNPKRPGLAQYQHAIDMCWESGSGISLYFNIANAKWRSSSKVDQDDVLLLQKVREKVAAHKALMITNGDFTAGARAVAEDEGIGLHIVTPSFDPSSLPRGDRVGIRSALQQIVTASTRSIFNHTVEHRGLDLPNPSPALAPNRTPWPAGAPVRRAQMTVPESRVSSGPQIRGGLPPGNSTRGGGPERRG